MKRLTPVQLPAWSLPLLALGISVPTVAAFALGGPGAGMAAGALLAVAILVVAARSRFDEEIEVAPARGGGGGVLAVVTAPIEGEAAVEAVRHAREHGDREAEVLVLAPARNSLLSHWASDLREARMQAQERLALSLAGLAKAGIDARGQVGDSDAVQATEDILRSFPAREVVFVTGDPSEGRSVAEVRRRLDRPVTHVTSADLAAGRS